MQYTVTRANNPAAMQAFMQMPRMVYRDGKIPPATAGGANWMRFMPLANPTLQHVRFANFVALEGVQPVGRITASYDLLNPRPEEGFWGSFECVERPEVARLLLDAAAGWLKKQGKTVMIGPATLNTNQQVGLLIEGFEYEPQEEIPYNPPYYKELLAESGLEKLHDLECFKWRLPDELPPKLRDATAPPGLTVRPVNYRAVNNEARIIMEINNRSMSGIWGFIPMTIEEASGFLQSLAARVPPDLFLIFEMGGEPAGMFLSIPIRRPGPDGNDGVIRLAIGGVVPEFQHRGIHWVVLREFYERCRKLGYTSGEASQVAESNDVVKRKVIKPLFGGKVIKLYRVYKRDIG
ncbi:GNAT family N-acetyltransferase [Desulfoscipio geothermicus]|uniref:N-acetyltransferase domain-containing protein n=1 Tax=Desulfoscipio geothermicus DSM 3669 TaxID=1121426 RepID=A0A1I6E6W7_9FIRM|nr:GNAT family N-acetyltransferase [Desulfoscipio geothermicus]SFR13292.1 hypothetical protein SAMN05660706_12728 [Desulfoscipio geothermicus DSM 3669]